MEDKSPSSPEPVCDTLMDCVHCSVGKPLADFPRNSKQCRTCLARKLRERRLTLIREPTVEPRICKRCTILKPSIDFRRSKESVGGIRRSCKKCEGFLAPKNPKNKKNILIKEQEI